MVSDVVCEQTLLDQGLVGVEFVDGVLSCINDALSQSRVFLASACAMESGRGCNVQLGERIHRVDFV